MKTSISFLAAVCFSFVSFGQNNAFKQVSLERIGGHEVIRFAPARETNVRNYRIEASNDSITFEVIAVVAAKGNPVLASAYSYDLAANNYSYYRIGQVGMGGWLPYSAVVSGNTALPSVQPKKAKSVVAPGASVVTK